MYRCGMSTTEPLINPTFLPARAVWERYGVTSMTLWRWTRDPEMGFPRPFYLGRYRYFRIAELEAWEASRQRVVEPEGAAA